ncbi:MAG: DUF4345 domain-containing protein [Alphaproteobacteria bacterium]|nr:MAG: DUF4345 domain-containing protein [Alphaproteobacteria bacterium]
MAPEATMSNVHAGVLYAALALLGLSLLGPGLVETFRRRTGHTWLIADSAEARSHLRGLHAMMTAVGMIALWALWDIERARAQVLALGVVLVALVVARLYSLLVDGFPGTTTLTYLTLEALLAALFLIWPPPVPAAG